MATNEEVLRSFVVSSILRAISTEPDMSDVVPVAVNDQCFMAGRNGRRSGDDGVEA